MARCAQIVAFPLLVCLLMATAAGAQTFTLMGLDPAEDDTEAYGSVGVSGVRSAIIPAPGDDQSNIDDVQALAIGATGDMLTFAMTVAERPEDSSTLQGQFCWVAAFQVLEMPDEYLILGCTDYSPAGETKILNAGSSRGTNIISDFEWDDNEPIVYLHAKFSSFGGAPGTTLTDIYGLTYMGTSLSVDDPAPDDKRDKDAGNGYGTWTIPVEGQAGYEYLWHYSDVDGDAWTQTLEFSNETWTYHIFNWTATGPWVKIDFNTTEDNGGGWTGHVFDATSGDLKFNFGPSYEDESSASGMVDAGPLNITLSSRQWSGTITLQVANAEAPPGQPSETTPPPTEGIPPSNTTSAPPTTSSGSPTGTSDGPQDEDSPASMVWVVGLLGVTLMARRKLHA